jgi:hypothetical protein
VASIHAEAPAVDSNGTEQNSKDSSKDDSKPANIPSQQGGR